MANKKFSAFAATGTYDTTTARIAGYTQPGSGSPTQNNIWTADNIAAGLATLTTTPYSIYAADGTIGTTRKALITDTIQFRNAGDTSDIFTLNTDGTFALGLGASGASGQSIPIGYGAACYGGVRAVALGYQASAASNSVSVGGNASAASAGNAVVVGGYSSATASKTVAVGYDADVSAEGSVALGSYITASGANSITLNANATAVTTSTANAFGVYMSSNTAADFEVIAGGESRLNSNLRISGQGYSALHNTTNATLTVNWNDGNVQELTSLTGSLTFTASNPKAGATYILTLAQTGTVTATWTGVKFPGGTAPTLSGSGKTDVITLICYDATGAGLYYGSATLDLA